MVSLRPLLLFWLVLSQFLLVVPRASAQNQSLPLRDVNEIKRLAKIRVEKDLPGLINNLLFEFSTESENEGLIRNSFTINDLNQQLFVSDEVIIEDDINPDHITFTSAPDIEKPVSRYLNDLLSYVSKNPDDKTPSFVITNTRLTDPIVDSPTSAHILVYFDSIFKGKSTDQKTAGRPYQRVNRVATLQVTLINKKWQGLISQILFLRPPTTITQAAPAPTSAPPAVVEAAPLPPVEIREPLKVFRQADYEFNVTIRYNRRALDVTSSESPRVPLGQYRNNGDGVYELAGNSIWFDETDKNKFTYKNRDRDIMGFVLVQPPKPKQDTSRTIAARPLPPVATPGYLPPNEEQRKRKAEPPVSTSAAEAVAAVEPKPAAPVAAKPGPEPVKPTPKPDVEKPKVVEPPKPTASQPVAEQKKPVPEPVADPSKAVATTTKPAVDPPKPTVEKQAQQKALVPSASEQPAPKPAASPPIVADVPKVAAKEKLPKPIIQKPEALSVAPALKKSLTSEQQRIVSGMRLRGWMQVVGGLAALGGSYVAYSGLKKDYDTYSQKVNALNADYTLYRDLSRRTIPPPPNVLSMTEYGSPTIYGVYGGSAIGLGLTVNGIRTLLRAGKMSKKK